MRAHHHLATIVCCALLLVGCAAKHNGPTSDHFDDTRFFTPGVVKSSSPASYLWRRLTDPPPDWPENVAPPAAIAGPPASAREGTARVTYVGHATLLIQVAGLNIVTDPVWSERASVFQWIGPKRVVAPAWSLDALPPIDIVLISHDHYDHLDTATLARIDALHRPRVIAPLGLKTLLASAMPNSRVGEHDWGERVAIGEAASIHIEPMAHGSGRTPFDQMKTLWAAFLIEADGMKLYHVGDSGYADGRFFRAARDKHRNIDLAILPIGAYEPIDFMADSHMSPREAMQAFIDSGARQALAHHFDTFQLGFERFGAAGGALNDAAKELRVESGKFIVPALGQVVEVSRQR
jgi:L-ascorbate metabolism protein UlaG (beta-lactamase superfamily)